MPALVREDCQGFEQIGEGDFAIEWAKQATDFDHGTSRYGLRYGYDLLTEHRPDEVLGVGLIVFRSWPDSGHATPVRGCRTDWPTYRNEVMAALEPSDSALFAFDAG